MNLKLTFTYTNKRGYGDLQAYLGGKDIYNIYARSGSCNSKGVLVNNLKRGIWYLKDAPVQTYEQGMVLNGYGEKFGWKQRLYTSDLKYTKYLIHPDQLPLGTKGCIGIQKYNAFEFYCFMLGYWTHYGKAGNGLLVPLEVI